MESKYDIRGQIFDTNNIISRYGWKRVFLAETVAVEAGDVIGYHHNSQKAVIKSKYKSQTDTTTFHDALYYRMTNIDFSHSNLSVGMNLSASDAFKRALHRVSLTALMEPRGMFIKITV